MSSIGDEVMAVCALFALQTVTFIVELALFLAIVGGGKPSCLLSALFLLLFDGTTFELYFVAVSTLLLNITHQLYPTTVL